MEAVLSIVIALLLTSGVLVTVRLVRGPSTLDRAVALDALVAVVMAGIGVLTAARQIPYYLPALLVLAFLGFTGSVSIARFLALRDEAGSEDPDVDDGGDRQTAGHDSAAQPGGPGGGPEASGGTAEQGSGG
ncbi:monovalent cation/H+ antiporter complex subunit F [Streptomyces sp. WMMB 322]|uniref:monovalent cation/H+ antiporter complex subunit F n=1 Tax=Streptomyces sp. WMMB 322 TaxID=1286821 RepID=UPI000823924B|nr:monovalent cation/H+ antiporter complex subunit F [Streptomyces sp. WMMB 322]SCK56975.1 multicomponent Na+:H+ antiporter subunit F [Streptomyces sp. WMMB 322]